MKRITLAILLLCISILTFSQPLKAAESNEHFVDFLEKSLNMNIVNNDTTEKFYQHSWDYWHANKLDYNLHAEKYSKAISLFYKNTEKFKRNNIRDVNRYEDKINNFILFDKRNTWAKNPVLFIGSSSIYGWETAISFPELPVINRGLGGMDVSEIIHYYDVIIKKHAPAILTIYCDIDIELGKSPSAAINIFKKLINKVQSDFPDTKILLLAMKPTLIDDFLGKDVRKNKVETNKRLLTYSESDDNIHFVDITKPMLNQDGSLRSDLFNSDDMHLNTLGYSLWTPIVKEKILSLTK